MDTNPNDIYKQAVLDLQARLGRPPTTRDPEYVRLGEELRLAWGRMGRAEETVLPPTRRASNHAREGWEQGMTASARDDAREANPLMDALRATADHLRDQSSADDAYARAHAALGGPGAADNEPEAVTAPGEVPGPDSASQAVVVDDGDDGPTRASGDWPAAPDVMVGARGPNDGIYAVCSSCRRVWERPKRQGRPAYKCEECGDG